MGRVRDYREVVKRLQKLPRSAWQVERVGKVAGYPFFRLERVVSRRLPTVLLSGGIHGEEPGGVEGVLTWLESSVWDQVRVNWFVMPCINPYGWERNQRRNAQRYDINRQFRNSSDCVEARLIKRLVKGRRFLFSIEFHEDVDASGYYLYELSRQRPYVGERVLQAVSRVTKINHDDVIDGNHATGVGLIRREPQVIALRRRRRWPMAYHLFLHCTDHILGSETPVHPPLTQRARAHTTALRTALRNVLNGANGRKLGQN